MDFSSSLYADIRTAFLHATTTMSEAEEVTSQEGEEEEVNEEGPEEAEEEEQGEPEEQEEEESEESEEEENLLPKKTVGFARREGEGTNFIGRIKDAVSSFRPKRAPVSEDEGSEEESEDGQPMDPEDAEYELTDSEEERQPEKLLEKADRFHAANAKSLNELYGTFVRFLKLNKLVDENGKRVKMPTVSALKGNSELRNAFFDVVYDATNVKA